ncbi:TMV resistance protein N-like isoform X2 [Vigna radiata var. radiata]|uniref:TMV resistance protein N-like isoform X2 n=1 Tax=Vigna radiata var. radiata TaxID=3916 RepID=A0A3Q0ELN1_VIGRR|nr:TMV resistance protein N-like isoform X2 [Vigna radiata var. radiata]
MSLSGSDDEMEMDFLRDRYQEMHSGNSEVFLSFRGEDTRASFTSHLYTALQNAGIFVFKDDESLPRGKQISPSLQLGIEESQISIVVFSKNYAESFWCLKELEKIMECHRTIGNVVLPVFYDVDPSEVRHQRGDFGKAFQRLLSKFSKEEEEKVLDWKQRWWKTLREICDISAVEILSPRIERVDKLDNQWEKRLLDNQWEKRLLDNQWEKRLLEVVQISKILDLNPRGKMKIADSIEILVRQSMAGLFKGAEIPFRKEKVDDAMDFLVKQWREVFCEAFSISEVALLDPC